MQPTQAGFLDFLRNVVVITTSQLPDNSPVIPIAYNFAMGMVAVPGFDPSGYMYLQMIYNLGTDFLINIAPDQPGLDFFASARKQFGLSKFVPGVIASSSDSSTSQSFNNPDFFKTLTLSDLQNLKTPWGRAYLIVAQSLSNSWGLS